MGYPNTYKATTYETHCEFISCSLVVDVYKPYYQSSSQSYTTQYNGVLTSLSSESHYISSDLHNSFVDPRPISFSLELVSPGQSSTGSSWVPNPLLTHFSPLCHPNAMRISTFSHKVPHKSHLNHCLIVVIVCKLYQR